jgi:hypothetical protein
MAAGPFARRSSWLSDRSESPGSCTSHSRSLSGELMSTGGADVAGFEGRVRGPGLYCSWAKQD